MPPRCAEAGAPSPTYSFPAATANAPGGFVVITRNRIPAPETGPGAFATLVARRCGRDTVSAAFEYYVPAFEFYAPEFADGGQD